MSKSTKNAGKPWSPQEVSQLKQFAKENTPTRVIGLKLGRPERGVYTKAAKLKISLKPNNQKPYNRQKK